jgi:uncharacterized protein
VEFLEVSWAEADALCKELAAKAAAFKPDWIVGISRGGLVPARLLCDQLEMHNVAIIRIEFYKKIGKTSDFPKITQPLQVDVKGKRVLIVDDVADTGMSLLVAKEHVLRAGASQVKIATLHEKPWSRAKPDFCAGASDAWIIYPWERVESMKEIAKMKKKGK